MFHRWCMACHESQMVNPRATPKAPLRPLSLIQVPFERIETDLFKSSSGHQTAQWHYGTDYAKSVCALTRSYKNTHKSSNWLVKM